MEQVADEEQGCQQASRHTCIITGTVIAGIMTCTFGTPGTGMVEIRQVSCSRTKEHYRLSLVACVCKHVHN